MSTEIATWNMIRSKIPTFPSPSAGRGNECLTKTEIQSLGGENLSINGNYGNSECAILEHIEKVTWEYTFNVVPSYITLNNAGDPQSVVVTSYKRKYLNDNDTGIQIDVPWNSSITNGFNINGNSISAPQNSTETTLNGTATFIQNESGKTAHVNVSQINGVPTWVYYFSVSPPSLNFAAIGGTQSVSVTSYKRKYINNIYTGTQENVGFGTSPSDGWLSSGGTSVTVSENTVTSGRTGSVTYTQHERGTTIPVPVGQDPAVITGNYIISANPSQIYDSVGASGTRRLSIISKYNEYLNGRLLSSKNIDWGLREKTTGFIEESIELAYSTSRKFRYRVSKVNTGESCEVYYERYTNEIVTDFATFQVAQKQGNAYTIIELTITLN